MAQKQMYDCLMIVGVQQWHGYATALRMYEQMQAQRPTVEQCQEAQKENGGAMSDNGLGCVWIGGIMAMVIPLAALTFGAPLINNGGLSWDNSAAIARFNAKVEVDRQREITRRIRSDNWHATAQQVAIVAGVVGVVGAIAWATQRSVTAWAARPHRQ